MFSSNNVDRSAVGVEMKELIREYVTLLLEKGEHTLSKWSDESDIAKVLKKRGVVLVPRGDKNLSTPFASGAYSVVYEGVYGGKRVVVKIATDQAEFQTLKQIGEAFKTAPATIRKHFMHVYESGNLGIENARGEDLYYAIIEWLDPLPTGIARAYFNYEEEHYMSDERKKEMSYVKNDLLRYIPHAFDTQEEFIKFVQNTLGQDRKTRQFVANNSELINAIINYIYNAKDPSIKGMHSDADVKAASPNPALANNVLDSIVQELSTRFPLDSSEANVEKRSNVNDVRVKSLLKAVEWLEKEKGISWSDVHEQNVRVRPGTDTLVLSDVGLFSPNGNSNQVNSATPTRK